MQTIKLYSDGAARGNPNGRGGYGTIVKYFDDKGTLTKTDEYGEGFEITSNNRMELLGVIIGLESLTTQSDVNVFSDSKYVVNAFEQNWIGNWLKNGWKTSSNKPVKNPDLWKRLLDAMKPHTVKFNWIKGHNEHPENERCDYLATSFADGVKLVKGEDGIFVLPPPENENK